MTLIKTTLAILAFAISSPATAATVHYAEDFSTGLGGWHVIDTATKTPANSRNTARSRDGGPDGQGYAEFTDRSSGLMFAVGNTGLTGDLSAMTGAELSLTLGVTAPTKGTGDPVEQFGTLEMLGVNDTMSVDSFSIMTGAGWQTQSVKLTAQAFGTSQQVFDAIIADVTSFRILVDGFVGRGDTGRIAAISIASVPLPAGALLLLSALGGLGAARRRQGRTAAVAVPTGLA